MNLVNQLTQFPLNNFNAKIINQVLSENPEGIFILPLEIEKSNKMHIINYLECIHPEYEIEINTTSANYEIMFRKKENN